MQPVFIDCHGFKQFHKVLNALCSPDLDLGRFISDVSITEVSGSNSYINYDLYTIQVLPADPMFNGSHCRLHEYLMDTLPTPARFITCMDYDDPADLWVATGETIEIDPSIPIYNAHTGLYS